MSDPFEGVEEQLSPAGLSAGLSTIELPDGVEPGPLHVAYLGLWSLLVRRSADTLGAEQGRRLTEIELRLQALEGPLRYELFEASRRYQGLERVGRISAGESRLKREWLIPKLETEIAAYRARITALRAALEPA